MKIKSNKGFVGTDIIIAVIAIIIFTSLIISLMYNNVLRNVKLKKDILATIFLTEVFENIGISNYEDVSEYNVEQYITEEMNAYNIQLQITEVSEEDSEKEDIIKKIVGTISYKVGNKEYSKSMERIKIKE